MIEALKDVGIVVGLAVLRSVKGWFSTSFADGKITLPEWRKLGATIVSVGSITALGYYGINAIPGVDIPIITAAAGGWVVDMIMNRLKKHK